MHCFKVQSVGHKTKLLTAQFHNYELALNAYIGEYRHHNFLSPVASVKKILKGYKFKNIYIYIARCKQLSNDCW